MTGPERTFILETVFRKEAAPWDGKSGCFGNKKGIFLPSRGAVCPFRPWKEEARPDGLMALCGLTAAIFDDFLEVRFDAKINAMVPSAQRATLLSVISLIFSLVMILLSPLLGMVFALA